jgi:cellulose synthase (UDP-forming)
MVHPTDIGTALAYAAAILAMLYVLSSALDRERSFDRVLFSSVSILLVGDYVAWRSTETLPSPDFSGATVWQWTFFAFETIAVSSTLISFLVLMRTSDHRALSEASERKLRAELATSKDLLPAVDVFICTYNEGLPVLEKTIVAARTIEYPNYTVWVLDDQRRGWLREYCEEVGVRYLTRPDNVDAKAGNLNNALRHSATVTNSPYILVLDADFACDSKILLRTLGLFTDPSVGLVQTPQFYYNADPIQHNLLCTRSWVDEQRLFFDIFQPAKDAWGAAFCVGTSFIVRRDLLDRLGGFPRGTIGEDLYLSYRLMQLGYTTRWLNEKLSVGLSAEGVAEYITQRTRWCLGAIQVALLEDGPVIGRGYTFMQRLHFYHGLLHWFGRPFIILMLAAPIIYWVLGFPAISTDFGAFLRHGVPAFLASWAFTYWRSDRKTLPFLTEVSQIIAALPITITILSAIVQPFGRPFKVTPKGGDRSSVHIHWSLLLFFGGLIAAMLLGISLAMLDPFRTPAFAAGGLFNLVWTIVAMLFCLIAMLVSIELPRPHGEERFSVREKAILSVGATRVPCTIDILSVAGAVLHLDADHEADVAAGRMIELELSGVGIIPAEVKDHDQQYSEINFRHDMTTRAALVRHLFTAAPVNSAVQARPFEAWLSILRRAFSPPDAYVGLPLAKEVAQSRGEKTSGISIASN